MKNLFTILVIVSISFKINAQKKKKSVIEEAVVKDIAIEETQIMDYYEEPEDDIDTLAIFTGNKYAFLIDVDENSYGSQVFGDKQEYNELKANFSDSDLEVIQINKYTYVVFENGSTLPITEIGQSYQAFAYWSGVLDDNVEVQEGLHFATEFIAKQMHVSKESSYVVNAKTYKMEVEKLINANKITNKSKITLDAFLANQSLPLPGNNEEEKAFSNLKPTNIKTLKTYFIESDKTERPLKSIEFNKNNQPILVKHYSSDGERSSDIVFTYNNDGMLAKVESGSGSRNIYYDDDKMIISTSNDEVTEADVYWLENNNLLKKTYELRNDDTYAYSNYYTEEKNENNCLVLYYNGEILKKNCTTKENIFPFINEYTSYQEGEVLQFRKLKITKKDKNAYVSYYSNTENERDADDYQLWGTFTFNDKQELTNYNFVKDGEKRAIKVDYTHHQ